MKLVEVVKKTTNKTEQVDLFLNLMCLLNGIYLSDTVRMILVYYVVYGLKQSTDDLIFQSKLVSGKERIQQLRNIKTQLYRKGFLKRDSTMYRTYDLNLSDEFKLEDTVNLRIKIVRS